MIVTPRDENIEQLVFEAGPTRSPGLHLSTIIQSLLLHLDPKRYGQSSDTGLKHNYFQLGFTFEAFLEASFAARRVGIVRPGEVHKDGIAMSPDGISLDDWVLEEFKCTWKTSRGAPDDARFWGWIVQMKAYCLALDMNRSRLRAFFINGDYKTYQPEYRVWDFEFTDTELQENWAMVVGHARLMGWLPR